MGFTVAKFLDVADGLQPNQFMIGDRDEASSLEDLDPIYKRLLEEPVTAVIAVMGGDGRPNLTPIWFDYEGDTVLLNFASHRKKTEWVRKNPEVTIILVNPANAYHWVSIKATITNEIHEDDPDADGRPADQVDKIWTKYTNNAPPYGLRDPSRNERRVLFEARVDRVATFGKP
jgi:PPOX class probable F420-dependent enzyme